MKVALTGANGLLGRPLVEQLLAAGHAVHVLVRDVTRAAAWLPPGVTAAFFEAGRPLKPDALAGAEAVIHLAGEPVAQRWTEEAKRRIRDSRALGTRGLVEAIGAAGGTVRHLVSASGVDFYGDQGDAPLTEESPKGEGFLADVCDLWEFEAQKAEQHGVRVTRVRLGPVLAPEGGMLRRLVPVFRWGAGGKVGSGRQYVPWIHHADAVGLLRFALETPGAQGALNAVAPTPVTSAELARALGRALHRPAALPAPAFALRAALGEMSEVLLASHRVLPQRALALGYRFRFPELAPALADLLGRG